MAAPLLSAGDPAPVRVVDAGAPAPALVLCDHAGAAFPQGLGTLGVPRARLGEHIALDIGALGLADALARRLYAPLIRSVYSRLVVDVNRFPGRPDSIPVMSDGIPVPGNRALSPQDRRRRLDEIFWPYHRAISGHLDLAPPSTLVISIHSFTPSMAGRSRPWHVGILWNQDRRLAPALIECLRLRGDLCVGDNQPYSATDPVGFTAVTHCEQRGFPHALVEVRQDLLTSNEAIRRWAEILQQALVAAWPALAGQATEAG